MKGILLIAHDNEVLDYGTMAVCCALMLRRSMPGDEIALIVDQATLDLMEERHSAQLLDFAFDRLILHEPVSSSENLRSYTIPYETPVEGTYHNTSRADVFELSPFDQTLVMDTDFFVMNNSLKQVWDSQHELMMNNQIVHTCYSNLKPHWHRVGDMTMPMYWATLFYFQKTDRVRQFFEIVQHVKENFAYYGILYKYATGLYRNDYAFTVAAHTLAGYGALDFVQPLPVPYLALSWDKDKLLHVGEDFFIIRTEREHDHKTVPCMVRDVNFHCMNKQSIQEQFLDLLYVYGYRYVD